MQAGRNTHRVEGEINVDGNVGGTAGIVVFHRGDSFHRSQKVFGEPEAVQIGHDLFLGQIGKVVFVRWRATEEEGTCNDIVDSTFLCP